MPANTTKSSAIPDFRLSEGYRGTEEVTVNATLLSLSILFVGLRLYVRKVMRDSLGLDDLLCTLGLCSLVALFSVDVRSLEFGSGAHFKNVDPSFLPSFFKLSTIVTLVYLTSVGLVRLSVCAFIPRLGKGASPAWIIRVAWALGIFVVLQTVACIVFRLTLCNPVAFNFVPPLKAGDKCRPPSQQSTMMLAHAATGLAVDVCLFCTPIYMIYTKMMWSRRTLQVLIVMSVGLFCVITGIVRIVLMRTLNFTADITYQMSVLGVWSNIEAHVGLWCACFPALQPLLRAIFSKLGIQATSIRSTHPGTGSNLTDPHARSGFCGTGTGIATATGAGAGNRAVTRTIIAAKGSGGYANGLSDGDSQKHIIDGDSTEEVEMQRLDMQAVKPGVLIYKTTETQVHAERRSSHRRADSEGWEIAS